MPLPLAHALVGASIGVTLAPERTPAGRRRAMIVGAALAICPDVDFVLGTLHVIRWHWHHGVTHSLAFAVLLGATAAWLLGLRGWRGARMCVLAVMSHPLLDYVITEGAGVALWWPVTSRRDKLGIDAISYYHITSKSEGALALIKLVTAELVLFVPVLAIAVVASRRRAHGCVPNTWSSHSE